MDWLFLNIRYITMLRIPCATSINVSLILFSRFKLLLWTFGIFQFHWLTVRFFSPSPSLSLSFRCYSSTFISRNGIHENFSNLLQKTHLNLMQKQKQKHRKKKPSTDPEIVDFLAFLLVLLLLWKQNSLKLWFKCEFNSRTFVKCVFGADQLNRDVQEQYIFTCYTVSSLCVWRIDVERWTVGGRLMKTVGNETKACELQYSLIVFMFSILSCSCAHKLSYTQRHIDADTRSFSVRSVFA